MKLNTDFLDNLGSSPRMRVLQHMIEGRDFDYTMTDLLGAEVSWGTLNSLVPQMLSVGLIAKTRKVGRATLYRINKTHPVAKHLIAIYDEMIFDHLREMEKYAKTLSSEEDMSNADVSSRANLSSPVR